MKEVSSDAFLQAEAQTACLVCHKVGAVSLFPHRDSLGNICGLVFACADCLHVVANGEMRFYKETAETPSDHIPAVGEKIEPEKVLRVRIVRDGTWYKVGQEYSVFDGDGFLYYPIDVNGKVTGVVIYKSDTEIIPEELAKWREDNK